VLQYSAISTAQAEVLQDSLGSIPSSGYIYEMAPDVFDAADAAQKHIEDENTVAQKEAQKILFDLTVDTVTGNVPIVSTVSAAVEVFNTVIPAIPWFSEGLERNEHITVCHVSNTVASLCRTTLSDDWSKAAIGTQDGLFYQKCARADLVMMMKANLLTRISLMDSGILTKDAYNLMAVKNERVAEMLNRFENARLVTAPEVPSVPEDLTWISKLAGKGLMGYAVDTGRYIYYWQYEAGSFDTCALVGNFNMECPATLVRVNKNGEEEQLFEGVACEFAVTATHIIYREDGKLCSRLIDGSKPKTLVSGELIAVNSYGQYIIYLLDGEYYSYDLWNDKSVHLIENGTFEAFHNGVIYYSVIPEYGDHNYEMAQKGSVTLRAVNVDGTDDRLMVVTALRAFSRSMARKHIRSSTEPRTGIFSTLGFATKIISLEKPTSEHSGSKAERWLQTKMVGSAGSFSLPVTRMRVPRRVINQGRAKRMV
jgi:hypothetical protein